MKVLMSITDAPMIDVRDHKHEQKCEALRIAREARRAKPQRVSRGMSFLGGSPKKALLPPQPDAESPA